MRAMMAREVVEFCFHPFSFTHRLLWTLGKNPRNGTLKGPQSRSGRFAERQDLFPLTGIET